MTDPSDEDIQSLRDYADRMQAMGGTPPVQLQAPPQPDEKDVGELRDYAARMQAMGDTSSPGFTRENPYGSDAAPAGPPAPSRVNTQAGNSRGSKLIDLPHGGAVIQDPDGYAAIVQRPAAERGRFTNTLDTTARGESAAKKDTDIEDYKKYLAATQGNRAKMMAASGYNPDVTQPAAAHALLAASIGDEEYSPTPQMGRGGGESNKDWMPKVERPPVTANETAFKRFVEAKVPNFFQKGIEKEEWYQKGLSEAQEKDNKETARRLADQHRILSANFAVPAEDDDAPELKTLKELPEDMSDLQQPRPQQGNELGAPDPYAALRKSQTNAPDPLQTQIQAEKAGTSAEDEAANKAWIQQQNNPQPTNPDERDQYQGSGTGTKSPADDYQNQGPANPNQIDPATGQPVTQGPPARQAPIYSPGGWARTISPTTQDMIEGAFGGPRQEQLAAQYMQMQHFNAQAQAEAAKRTGEAQAEMARQQAERERDAAIVQKQRGDLDAANRAYTTAKVDPDRFFKNRDTASNVMSAIGVALGAFGASLTHSPNFALEIVNKAVDNDIDAQKAEMAKLGKNADNQLAQLRDATGSHEAAEGTYRLAALQYAQAKAGELDTQGKGAALQKMFGDEIAKEQKFLAMYRANTEKYVAPQMIGGADTGVDEKEQSRVFQLPHDMSGYAGGTTFIAKTEKDAEALKTATEGYGIMQGLRDKVSALEKKYGRGGLLYGEGRNAYDALVTNAVSQAGHVNAVARQPVVDTQLLHEQLKLPDSISDSAMNGLGWGPSPTQRWDNALDAYSVSHRTILQTRAVEQAHPYYGVTPSGKVKPEAEYTGNRAAPQAPPPGFKRIAGGGGSPLPNRVLPQSRDVRRIPEPQPKGRGRSAPAHPPPDAEQIGRGDESDDD